MSDGSKRLAVSDAVAISIQASSASIVPLVRGNRHEAKPRRFVAGSVLPQAAA